MNRATNRSWSGPICIHAEINSQTPRTERAHWALEISGSILTEEAEALVDDGRDSEIGIVKAFLIQLRAARQETLDASVVLNAKSFATSEYAQLFKKESGGRGLARNSNRARPTCSFWNGSSLSQNTGGAVSVSSLRTL
jgi:hypothetical protein